MFNFFNPPVPSPMPPWEPSPDQLAAQRRQDAMMLAASIADSTTGDKLIANAKKIEMYLKGETK